MDRIFKPNQRKWISSEPMKLAEQAIKLRKMANEPIAGLNYKHGIAYDSFTAVIRPPSPHATREHTKKLEREEADIKTLANLLLKPNEGAQSMEQVNEALENIGAIKREFDSMNIDYKGDDESEEDDGEDDMTSTDESSDEEEGPLDDGDAAFPPAAMDLIQRIEARGAKEEVEEGAPGVASAGAIPYIDVLEERDKKHDAEFAVFYKYSENKATERAKRALWRDKKAQMEEFGYTEKEYMNLASRTASTLAFDPHEVMVDDPVTKGVEMPLLAGPIPHKAIRKLTTLALYSSLSDEPGNFQWKSTHVMEQLTANQQAERQWMRKYQRDGRRMEKKWPPYEFIVTISFYQPSEPATYDLKAAGEPKPGLEIELLGSHTLKDLASQFYCQRNYACTKDCQEFKKWITIDEAMGRFEGDLAMNVCKGDVLYIHDTCYTDGSKEAHDHYLNVRRWISDAPNGEIDQYFEKAMEGTKIRDLTVRFGYPYMYLHQGDCEHIVVFNAMRLPRAVEFLTFPRYEIMGKYTTKFCRIDKEHMARWIVAGSDRFPEDPIFLCNSCVEEYCFTKGGAGNAKKKKKIGDFKLFPFLQITAFV